MGKEPVARPRPLSVNELNRRARDLVERSFPDVWVEAEVGEIRRPPSGHLYFTLKDKTASVAAVMWASGVWRLDFPLEAGLRVVVRGHLTVFPATGKYQIVCRSVALAGEGALRAAFVALKAKLEAEGLTAKERKRPLPFLPRAVGLVTSPSGAAVHDMLRAIRDRFPTMRCVLMPVPVQGDGAARALADGLRRIARVASVDVVVIGRGGGSAEDLAGFNDERLARAIASCEVPVVSAVGHEIDVTIADLVADVRALTPTAAGELVAPDLAVLWDHLDGCVMRLTQGIRRTGVEERRRLTELGRRPGLSLFPRLIEEQRQITDGLVDRMTVSLAQRMRTARAQLDGLGRALSPATLRVGVAGNREALRGLDRRLDAAARAAVAVARSELIRQTSKLDALDPTAVLARGFTLTRLEDIDGGPLLRSAADAPPGARVRTTFADGPDLISEVNCSEVSGSDGDEESLPSV
ncbi:MAG: exodeoxyribonuclease VII large subunit [Planctomycetes bacterium]|nr:exodeoxyribonuclease VII large subunit [Planctomycetota bacterium]